MWELSGSKIFVQYVLLHQLLISVNTIHDWPNYIMAENLPGSLQCRRCDKLCNLTSSIVKNADFFIYCVWSRVSYGDAFFSEIIILGAETHHLIGLVTHRSSHFTCTITANLFHKDLFLSMIFSSLQLLCQNITRDWFPTMESYSRIKLNLKVSSFYVSSRQNDDPLVLFFFQNLS